jgi:hypothetical protein
LSTGGNRYAAFVEQELKAERDRRTSLDARSQSFVTSSGGLVTILAAVGAFVSGRAGDTLPPAAVAPLIATVLGFTTALVFAILATYNFAYRVADRRTLEALPRGHWEDNDDTAAKNVVATNVATVLTLRQGNNKKVSYLLVALFAQLIALVALGATVYLMITA